MGENFVFKWHDMGDLLPTEEAVDEEVEAMVGADMVVAVEVVEGDHTGQDLRVGAGHGQGAAQKVQEVVAGADPGQGLGHKSYNNMDLFYHMAC